MRDVLRYALLGLLLCLQSVPLPAQLEECDDRPVGRDELDRAGESDLNGNGIPDRCDLAGAFYTLRPGSRVELEHPSAPIVVDLDSDAYLDIVAARDAENSPGEIVIVAVFGDESATLERRTTTSIAGGWISAATLDLSAGDFDGDRVPDLAVAGRTLAGATVVLALGDRERFNVASRHVVAGSLIRDSGSFVDIDGDGDLDFAQFLARAAGSPFGGSTGVGFLLRNVEGVAREEAFLGATAEVMSPVWGDFDGDGLVDLVALNSRTNMIWTRDSRGGFRTPRVLPRIYFSTATAADLDGDGDLDLAYAVGSSRAYSVAWNDGDGFRDQPAFSRIALPEGVAPELAVSAIDVDGDGRVDVCGGVRRHCAATDGRAWFAKNHGEGDISAGARLVTAAGRAARSARHSAFGDVNGDGIVDVVQADEDGIGAYLGTLGPISRDCNGNGVPDESELDDCDGDTIPDDCEPDADGDGFPDGCGFDCNENGIRDEQDIAAGHAADCDENGVPDECELELGDRNRDGTLDACQIGEHGSPDCNSNGIPDPIDLHTRTRFGSPLAIELLGENLSRTEASVGAIAAGDVDGDEWTDVLVARTGNCCPPSSGTIEILSNLEGRLVARGVVVRREALMTSFAAGDLDADGDLDVVVGITPCLGTGSSRIESLVNTGNGETFVERDSHASLGTVTESVLEDFDGDGDADLVTTATMDSATIVQIWWNGGSGVFSPGIDHLLTEECSGIDTPDLDDDGIADIVVGTSGDRHAWILLSTQEFDSGRQTPSVSSMAQVGLAFADFNRDQKTDVLAIPVRDPDRGWIHERNDDGTWITTEIGVEGVEGIPLALPREEDRIPDVAFFSSQRSAVLLTVGSFSRAGHLEGGSIYGLRGPLVEDPIPVDLDRDGRDELLIATADSLSVVGRTSNGAWSAPRQHDVDWATTYPIVARDLDGDGDLDLASVRQGSPLNILRTGSQVIWNTPDGLVRANSAAAGSEILAIGAVDRDRSLDFVVRSFLDLGYAAGRAAGDRRAARAQIFAPEFRPSAAVVADLTGDERAEIVAASELTRALHTFFVRPDGDANLAFEPGPTIRLGNFATFLRSADFNADGFSDIAVIARETTDPVSASVGILLGRGDGSFEGPRRYAVRTNAHAFVVDDFDGDGNADVAVGGPERTLVFAGVGDGRLIESVECRDGPQTGLAVADFSGDGLAELAIGYPGRIDVSRGLGAMTFGPPRRYAVTDELHALAPIDIDGDGDHDLAAMDLAARMISVFETTESVTSLDTDRNGVPDECQDVPRFIRGEVNATSGRDISDAIAILNRLFGDGRPIACLDAADVNDDGGVNIADPIALLSHLFGTEWPQLPAPAATCGFDATQDELDCLESPSCPE